MELSVKEVNIGIEAVIGILTRHPKVVGKYGRITSSRQRKVLFEIPLIGGSPGREEVILSANPHHIT